MIITHVYRPFVTFDARGNVLLRFGKDAADASRNGAYMYTAGGQSWPDFVKTSAQQFLDVNFKEY